MFVSFLCEFFLSSFDFYGGLSLFPFVFFRYQLKVFDVAKKRNTIAVLETGAGKTMIAVMLIKHIAESLKSNGDKKLVVFLAPSVHLVHQVCFELYVCFSVSFVLVL